MVLCPSMMCVNYVNLGEETHALEEAGIDVSHCNIMDGSLIPNTPMELMGVKAARALTKKVVNIHLMIDHPTDKIDWFLDTGADLIYIHPKSELQAMRTLMCIHSRGKSPGLAVNPDISLSVARELLPHCDCLSIMSVSPGFVGQTFIDSVNTKIRKLIACKKMYGYRIILDGACSPAVIQEYRALSVDGFVLGTGVLFHGEGSYVENMNLLRSL